MTNAKLHLPYWKLAQLMKTDVETLLNEHTDIKTKKRVITHLNAKLKLCLCMPELEYLTHTYKATTNTLTGNLDFDYDYESVVDFINTFNKIYTEPNKIDMRNEQDPDSKVIKIRDSLSIIMTEIESFYVKRNVTSFQLPDYIALAMTAYRNDDVEQMKTYINQLTKDILPPNNEVWNAAGGCILQQTIYAIFAYYIDDQCQIEGEGTRYHISQEIIDNELEEMFNNLTSYNIIRSIIALTETRTPDNCVLTKLFTVTSMLPTNTLTELVNEMGVLLDQFARSDQTKQYCYQTLNEASKQYMNKLDGINYQNERNKHILDKVNNILYSI